METLPTNPDYRAWLTDLKARVRSSQIKAALRVNTELLSLYWELGEQIVEKQKTTSWGGKLIEQLSNDLAAEFPEMKGFSRQNLYYIRQWYLFYNQDFVIVPQVVGQFESLPKIAGQLTEKTPQQIVQQLVALIPWGHNREILSHSKTLDEALFYVAETLRNGWSRAVLGLQMESRLFERQGKAIHNFDLTLPKPQSDLARELLKNPYNFDFLTLGPDAHERDIEAALTEHITKFLLELGKGFAYVGRQYPLEVGGEDFFIDLLFYHLRLRCYVVIELKAGKFKPEYAGKLNFYLSAVDDLLRTEHDQRSIGLLLCKAENGIVAEYALRDLNKPMALADFKLTDLVPEDLKGSLPTIEELEAGLNPLE